MENLEKVSQIPRRMLYRQVLQSRPTGPNKVTKLECPRIRKASDCETYQAQA